MEHCRRLGLEVVRGSIFDAGLPAGPWDLITFWDVIDQLESPVEALRLAAAGLAPRGTVVVRGRNAKIHAPLKKASVRARRLARGWRLPDPAVVHRWGITPAGYQAMMRRAGLVDVRLYPGLPTPRDRYGTPGLRRRARSAVKAALRAGGMVIHQASFRRLYPFLTVMVSGRSGTYRQSG